MVQTLTCADCGCQFDLSKQAYYDDLCPTCKEAESGEDVVNPVYGQCYVCDEDVRKNEEYYSSKAAPYDVRGKVMVCPDHRDHKWTPSRGI